jgi:hypothetical protein
MLFRSVDERAGTKVSHMTVSSYAYDIAKVEQKGHKNVSLNCVKPLKN